MRELIDLSQRFNRGTVYSHSHRRAKHTVETMCINKRDIYGNPNTPLENCLETIADICDSTGIHNNDVVITEYPDAVAMDFYSTIKHFEAVLYYHQQTSDGELQALFDLRRSAKNLQHFNRCLKSFISAAKKTDIPENYIAAGINNDYIMLQTDDVEQFRVFWMNLSNERKSSLSKLPVITIEPFDHDHPVILNAMRLAEETDTWKTRRSAMQLARFNADFPPPPKGGSNSPVNNGTNAEDHNAVVLKFPTVDR